MTNQGEDTTNPESSSFSIDDKDHDQDKDLKFVFRKENLSGVYITTTLNLTRFKNNFSIRKAFDKIAFIGFCLGVYEIVTDLLSSYIFIHGTDYLKIVNNRSDPAVTSEDYVCKQLITTNTYNHETKANQTSFTFSCFEQVSFLYVRLVHKKLCFTYLLGWWKPGGFWQIRKQWRQRWRAVLLLSSLHPIFSDLLPSLF